MGRDWKTKGSPDFETPHSISWGRPKTDSMLRKRFLHALQSTREAQDLWDAFAAMAERSARRESVTRSGRFFQDTRDSPAPSETSATMACFKNSGSHVKVTQNVSKETHSCTNTPKSATGSGDFFPAFGTRVSDSTFSSDFRTVDTASATSWNATPIRLLNAPAFESDAESSAHELERTAYVFDSASGQKTLSRVSSNRSFSVSERAIFLAATPVTASDAGTGNPFSESIRQFSALLPIASAESPYVEKTPFRTGTIATHSNSKSQSSRHTSQTLDAAGKPDGAFVPIQFRNSETNSGFLKYAYDLTTCEKSAQAISRSSRTVSIVCATLARMSSELRVLPSGETDAVHETCTRLQPPSSTLTARENFGQYEEASHCAGVL